MMNIATVVNSIQKSFRSFFRKRWLRRSFSSVATTTVDRDMKQLAYVLAAVATIAVPAIAIAQDYCVRIGGDRDYYRGRDHYYYRGPRAEYRGPRVEIAP